MLAFKDDLLDAQLVRAVGAAAYGGSDLGECLAAAREVDESDLDSWYVAWHGLATRVHELARSEDAAGRRVSARAAYLRACTYHRTAGVMLVGVPVDRRLVDSNAEQTQAFRSAAALMDGPVEVVAIPYGQTTLPGYFFSVDDSGIPRATVVLTGGYDGTCEELYFFNGAAALARGYNVLAFDGPGQGAALLQQGLTLRPDWEAVVTPVMDFLAARSDVDSERIALIGLSLGAHLAPRAAAYEPRIAALIADCGAFDLRAGFLARMPARLAVGYLANRRTVRLALSAVLKRMAKKPTAGWALRRGQLVHGVASPLAYLDSLAPYSLADHASRIGCPSWICNAEDDDIGASAPELVAALTSPHEFVQFRTAEGAGDHCEQAARSLYHARSFGWLDQQLEP
ncbi:MAG TPA: alpha/beta fold hydrolase [Frankiaceae bacterium]|nr:alpha/beta fold hydrolase [Frankiaceae bacterium]